MKWLIQDNVFDCEEKTIKYLEENGEDVKIFTSLIPTISEAHFFRGSIENAQKLNGNENIELMYDGEHYNFSYFAPKFGELLFNKDYDILPIKEFSKSRDRLIDKYGKEDFIANTGNKILFVRPNSGNKGFTGQVIDDEFWKSYCNMFRRNDVKEIVISSAKKIKNEYRFVVQQDFVKAGSYYIKEGEVVYENVHKIHTPAQLFAENSSFRPPQWYWIMDLAETYDGKWGVIEVNAFSTSDLYNIDRKVLKYLSDV